ncbi:MAG TPA: hypothetical protein H9968_11465 [Candidatus Anaerobutyricum stercoris]|uniref:Uncharacterized protein n=1 Tax=Candidatus Anaerobutyricum stercoris TaxID=2838457 RepID=A0A9D2EMP1_9FIRM|nr:hypothetical protein [Candidatus Anaerobutyricum stercoris]
MLKKYFVIIIVGFCLCLGEKISVQAADTITSHFIPERMPANSVIEYEGDGQWNNLGTENVMMKRNRDIVKNEEKVTLPFAQFSKSISQLKKVTDDEPIYEEVLPNPQKGMRVEYDNWGEINKIFVFNGTSYKEVAETFAKHPDEKTGVSLFAAKALKLGTRLSPGTYPYGQVEEKTTEQVGYTQNVIKITSNKVVGKGDFTVFWSIKGDHENYLKEGDCATKGAIDNPKSNTKIEVTNKLKNITATFYKNDNGDLPNAVIDIWKTGVKRLGVNKTNYSKIKKAGKYKYTF